MAIIWFGRLNRVVLLAGACVLLGASLSQAGQFSFHVDVDTSSLVGSPDGPFSLDFQLNQGSGTATNSVTLDDFSFTGGTPTGAPNLFGGATGDLSSSVMLTDASNPFNEFFQGFSAGTTNIGFDVALTTDVDPTIPDSFAMAILDSGTNNITTAGLGDSLMLVNITSSNVSFSDVQTFASTGANAGVTVAATPVTVTATPEPGSLFLLAGAGLIALASGARKRFTA